MEDNIKVMIDLYNSGESINAIARFYDLYPATVERMLKKNNVELRHDAIRKGVLSVKHGEELIEWAKAQGRLVTKEELAKLAGTKRLSPSYFIKYPELGQYVQTRNAKVVTDYAQILYTWLQKYNIKYKPKDRTKLNMSVTALLLEKYDNIAIQINIKPKYMSKPRYDKDFQKRVVKAETAGIKLIILNENDFKDDLKKLKDLLFLEK